MTDRLLIPFNGELLALTIEQFEAARTAAQDVAPAVPVASAAVAGELLTAEQLEQRTSVPASWWGEAARENRVPHRRIGKYVRFVFAEVEATFRPTDCDSLSAVRSWRKSGT